MRPLALTHVGQYRILDFVGAGGMGEVYRAEHTKIGRMAAVKVLTQAGNQDGSLDRFFNEARIQSSLRHPNIATLYDFTEVDGYPCIIMEYVDGQTLAERVRPCGPLGLAETVFIFQAVVEAIDYTHNHGVVHRDIKSNNIKISSAGEVKLLDFGIAKSEASKGLTATGSVIGTLEYLSPEQLMGGVADARSDIWALGVLLYEIAVGRVPFEALTIGELCKKIQKVDYAPAAVLNPTVPREITAIITRCLRKNPTDRYRTARDLLEDTKRLRALVSTPGLSDASRPEWRPDRTVRIALSTVDRKLVAAIGAVLVVLLLVGSGIYVVSSTSLLPSSKVEDDLDSQNAGASDTQEGNAESKSITIDAVGSKARVYLNGSFIGDTPCPINARIGETVSVELRRDGFEPYVDTFSVTAQTRIKNYSLQRVGSESDSP